jgi:hypothetical protein
MQDDDALFSTRRIAGDGEERNSVVVVGLPRSGSSFLSHVLSQVPGWYVFDDLTLGSEVATVGAHGALDQRSLNRLVEFLGWQVWARKKHGLYSVPTVEKHEVARMNDALRASFTGQEATWLDLQEEWLVRLAERNGCRHWGFKSPRAYRGTDQLFATYPRMKGIFIMRRPDNVLSSYKNMPPDSQDGHPGNYHPLTHAWLWRTAADAWLDLSKRYPGRLMLIRFEDLLSKPQDVAKTAAKFLGAKSPDAVHAPPRPNTSFTGTTIRQLTGLEHLILKFMVGDRALALGFDKASAPRARFQDVADLTTTTARFATHRSRRAARRLRAKLAWRLAH